MALHDLSATAALAGLQSGQFCAVDYVKALLERASACAGLNAFSHLDERLILADAKSSDAARLAARKAGAPVGPLHGLPVAIKDNINVADQPTSAGTPALRNHRPATDAPVVAALRRAGAILFGRTNMHELAYGLTSNNAAFGAVRNPFNPAMIAGGSSGGSATAVAAHIVPAALGTDTGGSVRVPAALCGLVGFRPTHGRYCGDGIVPISHSRDTVGVLARDVADAVLLDRVISRQRQRLTPVSISGLRIGIPRGYFFDTLDGEVRSLVERALERLSGLGAVLIEADIAGIEDCNPRVGRPIASGEVLQDLPGYLEKYAGSISIEDLLSQVASPDVRAIIDRQFDPHNRAAILSAYDHAMNHSRPALRQCYEQYFDAHQLDAIALPTTPVPARPIGDDEYIDLAGGRVPTGATYIRNTGPASIIGAPGLTVPAGLTCAGLPVGLELDGQAGLDNHLLAIGLAWEYEYRP